MSGRWQRTGAPIFAIGGHAPLVASNQPVGDDPKPSAEKRKASRRDLRSATRRAVSGAKRRGRRFETVKAQPGIGAAREADSHARQFLLGNVASGRLGVLPPAGGPSLDGSSLAVTVTETRP
jgi:hypothetical protein